MRQGLVHPAKQRPGRESMTMPRFAGGLGSGILLCERGLQKLATPCLPGWWDRLGVLSVGSRSADGAGRAPSHKPGGLIGGGKQAGTSSPPRPAGFASAIQAGGGRGAQSRCASVGGRSRTVRRRPWARNVPDPSPGRLIAPQTVSTPVHDEGHDPEPLGFALHPADAPHAGRTFREHPAP